MNLTETLSSALLNLTKQDAIHYETVATQIRETRTALLLASGTDISKMDELNERLATLEKVEVAIASKTNTLANYEVLIAQARARLKSIYEETEKAAQKASVRKSKPKTAQ